MSASTDLDAHAQKSKRPRGRRTRVLVLCVAGLAILASSCAIPAVPPYPYWGSYGSEQGVINEVQRRSDRFQAYIECWMDNNPACPASIPAEHIPEAMRNDPDLRDWKLVRPQNVTAESQWLKRPYTFPIDHAASMGEFPDPHVSYGLIPHMLLPFGSKVIIEGDFPRGRYFSLQPTASFDPEVYKNNAYGAGEGSFLDADINPKPGHTNPYRVGANRNATSRGYRVECIAKIGDPKVTDPKSWERGVYRDVGNNTRHCSGYNYRGAWGDPNWDPDPNSDTDNGGDQRGLFETGNLWMRIYAPDKAHLPWGGVSFPKVSYQLQSGRHSGQQFFVAVDFSKLEASLNSKRALPQQAPVEDTSAGQGWSKQMSILQTILGGLARYYDPSGIIADQEWTRAMIRGVEGRGENEPGVRGQEPHATAAVHINYLARSACLGNQKVVTISGRLPTTPQTRNGEATMTSAQARYWSITGYSQWSDLDAPGFDPGTVQVSVMDDEIVKNAAGEYTLVFSRPQDRPSNATAANGVTWVNWGPEACLGFTIRWMSIRPEWSFSKAPDETRIGYNADWPSVSYNPNLIGRNNRSGFLGAHQPVVGVMTKTQFQTISAPITPAKIPGY